MSRLPRLNKSEYVNVVEDDLFLLLNGKANYTEENKLVYFDEKLQLVVVKNKETEDGVSIIRRKYLRRYGKMFSKIMNYIKDFLENTPGDIYEFSVVLEDALVDNYDEMYKEQPRATEVLADETPDICASAEPGMKSEEINEFKCKLKMEYNKALKAIV